MRHLNTVKSHTCWIFYNTGHTALRTRIAQLRPMENILVVMISFHFHNVTSIPFLGEISVAFPWKDEQPKEQLYPPSSGVCKFIGQPIRDVKGLYEFRQGS